MAKINGIKVGTSNITAKYGSLTSNTVVLTVTALNLQTVGSIGALSNQTYTGNAIKLDPVVKVTATGVGTDVTLTKGTHYDVAWASSDSNACTAVGTVTVTVTGKGNYTGTLSTSYSIVGAEITVKTSGKTAVENQTYTYNGSQQGVGLVATTVNNQTPTIKYRTASSGDYTLTSAPQITNVSQSPLTVYYQVTAPNHQTKTGSYTITINQAPITIPTPTGITKTYDGSAYSASFSSVTGASITKYRYDANGGSSWTETTSIVSRTAAGTTTVQAYYTADGNHSGSGWSSTASIKINPADFTVSAGNQSYPWTGNAQGAAITVRDLAGSQTATIKYRTASSGDYNLTSAPQITNVSQSPLTVYWQVTAPNHNTQTGSYTITITAPAISIPAPTSNEKTYTGTTYYATFPAASYATITSYQTSTNGTSWSDAGTSNPGRSTQGTTYVRAYYTADGNHSGSGWSSSATIKINAANITKKSAGDQSYPYTGSAQGIAPTFTTVNSQAQTITYGTTSGSYTSSTVPQRTNAGSQVVYYKVTAPNHNDLEGSYTLSVTKITPTFTLAGEEKVYHNTAYIKATASVAGTVHWGTSASSMTSTTTVPAGTATNVTSRVESDGVGTTTIYAYFTPTDTTNYNSVGSSSEYSQSAAAKITASNDNDITISVSSNLAYNGANQIIATKTGGEGCASFTLGYSTTSNGTVTWGTENATTLSVAGPGTYYIHYKVTPDANHSRTITDKQIDPTAVINSGTLTITITGYSGTYDANAHNIVASGPTTKNQEGTTVTGVTYTYSTSENGTYGSMPTITNATGTSSNENATVTYWVKAEKSGYTTAKKSFTVYVARAANPLTITPTTATIYNTSGYNTVQITPSGAQGAVTYSSNATSKASVNSSGLVTYVAAGTGTVITATAAGNANYKSGSKTCTVDTVVDTITSYGDLSGTIVITQNELFPASGVSLSTSNIGSYFSYSRPCTQTITWASGNTTSGTITYAWSGTSTTIPSLGTSETSEVTPRTISFTVTATGEGANKKKSTSVSSGNQEANPVTGITLTLVTAGDTTYAPKTQVAFGSSLNTRVMGTFKSGETGEVTPTLVTSSDTTVATVS